LGTARVTFKGIDLLGRLLLQLPVTLAIEGDILAEIRISGQNSSRRRSVVR
jgi:hypothetical protein